MIVVARWTAHDDKLKTLGSSSAKLRETHSANQSWE